MEGTIITRCQERAHLSRIFLLERYSVRANSAKACALQTKADPLLPSSCSHLLTALHSVHYTSYTS